MAKLQKITVILLMYVVFYAIPQASAQESTVLKQGMSGSDVSILQTTLKEYGYYQGDIDQQFGSGTREAVIEFQIDCGLEPDGVVGSATLQALHNFKSRDNASRGQSNRWKGQRITSYAKQFLGVPYIWAGRSPSGFDCSGFVSYVFGQNGISIPRMADEQFEIGLAVNRYELQQGDLVFFTTYEPGPSHVGIYIGNGQFIHASSGAGYVTTTSMSSQYYQARYLGARRII